MIPVSDEMMVDREGGDYAGYTVFLSNPYKRYNEQDMDAAVQDVNSGRLNKLQASKKYNIPESTLRYQIKKRSIKWYNIKVSADLF